MNLKPRRDSIPSDVKKKVRKRCGYGCVFCGYPLYHYDHIIEYSIVKEHDHMNITLLCGTHHDQKSRGVLPVEQVIIANLKPFAIINPLSRKETLFLKKSPATVRIATNELFVDIYDGAMIMPFIIYKRTPFHFDVESGQLLLSGEFRDENNILFVKIDKNEILFLTQDYDIDRVGSKIIVRKRKGIILLCININPEKAIIDIERAFFSVKDISIKLNKTNLQISNSKNEDLYLTMSNCSFPGNVGFSIYSPPWLGRLCHFS
jgi:hypothetical protein